MQVTDKDGLTFVQDLLIHVSNGNDAPTGATLSNNEVAENLPADTEVGTLTASDPDRSDVHTFKITGGADKALFQIQGDKLLTSASLDYEAKAELEVIVQVTDDSGAYLDVILSFSVTDANDPPTDLVLDNDTVAENETTDTIIGKLSLTDTDRSSSKEILEIDPEKVGQTVWRYRGPFYNEANTRIIRDKINSLSVSEDGTVYFAGQRGTLNALSSDGTLKWSYKYQGYDEGYNQSTPVVAKNGTIYIGSRSQKIYAFNPDGTKKWEFETGGEVNHSCAIGIDGTIYCGSADQRVYAINPDGTKKWEFMTVGPINTSVSIGVDNTILFGATVNVGKGLVGPQKIYSVNSDGALRWVHSHSNGEIMRSLVIGSDNSIYFSTWSGWVYALHPDSTPKWSTRLGNGSSFSAPALGEDGTVYAANGGFDDGLHALSPDGEKLWKYSLKAGATSAPAVGSDGTIYVADYYGRVYAVKPDGTKKWENNTYRNASSTGTYSELVIGGRGLIYSVAEGNYNTMWTGDIVATQGSSGPADSPWPMFGQNAQRTSRAQGNYFQLVAGEGDTDNSRFKIDIQNLALAAPLDFEAQEEYSIRVKGDPGGLSIEKVFTINVTDVNEAPTSITLDNDTVQENAKAGTVVGRLTGTDPEGDKLTFALAEDDETVDNEKFSLKSPTLSTAEVLDADTNPTLTVRLVATDPDGLSFEQDVTISVTNINEGHHARSQHGRREPTRRN